MKVELVTQELESGDVVVEQCKFDSTRPPNLYMVIRVSDGLWAIRLSNDQYPASTFKVGDDSFKSSEMWDYTTGNIKSLVIEK